MKRYFICHYSEIGLKGRNRSFFERSLTENIQRSLRRHIPGIEFHVQVWSKRILLGINGEVETERIYDALSGVFGLVNFNEARRVPNDLEALKEAAEAEMRKHEFTSFAMRAQRADKQFPFTTPEICRETGAHIVDRFSKKVDLKNPDLACYIEVLKNESFVYAGKTVGPGGLPLGSSGKVMVLMSGGFDSPIAAYYAMRRGARCHFVHFHSYPFTEKTSQEKVKDLVKVLTRYQFRSRLFMVPFAETQKKIVMQCPESYRVLLYRRFMMRIAERLARWNRARAIVTGESLGQVASQTLDNMGVVEAVTRLPVLRPLIGMDKNEIIAMSRKIGTHDISSLPHDDACTRFMPKHPVIHGRLEEAELAESRLGMDEMINADLQATERIDIE